jgi:tetratricopeptide (TPR) repeat protein
MRILACVWTAPLRHPDRQASAATVTDGLQSANRTAPKAATEIGKESVTQRKLASIPVTEPRRRPDILNRQEVNMNNATMLDHEELMHLAITASANADYGNAIAYLKLSIGRDDAPASSHFLLGCEYAQISMHDRALAHMHKAVEMDADMAIARFQLGMLYLTLGDGETSQQTLEPLEQLADDHPLAWFSRGLRHLIADNFEAALYNLQQGLPLNRTNPALNANMQRVMKGIAEHLAKRDEAAANDTADTGETPHVLMSAYAGAAAN